jgi:hypothetical protein
MKKKIINNKQKQNWKKLRDKYRSRYLISQQVIYLIMINGFIN